jgi:hypothetical protein
MPAAIDSAYDAEIAERVCAAIAITPKGLQKVIDSIGSPVSAGTFWRWLQIKENDLLREMYARAKAAQVMIFADEITEISDNTQEGVIITEKPDGTTETKRADMLEHRKLRIESRKWLAAKLMPKVYGDKQLHTGPNGDDPVTLKTIMVEAESKPDRSRPALKPEFDDTSRD